ncbi:hypothetical protein EDB19DRAFT_1907285 [Suillus lakei]|nr:hypothetical protein EDB19DRAFT_1907285 [Suillus lakei]
MSSTEASHRTCASNATTRPGKIVLDTQTKRCTKAQKAADNLAIKEAKEAKEVAVQKGVERLAGMQVEMERVQKELLTNKATPVRPKPKAQKATKGTVKGGDDCTNSVLDDVPDADVAEDAAEPMNHGTSGQGKKAAKKSGKKLIRDAISNVQKKISKSTLNAEGDININSIDDKPKARADGKGSTPSSINATTQKFTLGGRVTNWVSGTQIPSAPTQVADCIPEDALTGGFADEIDDSLEREAACLDSKQKKGKSKVASIFDEDSDCGGPKAPFTQIPSIEFNSDDELMDSFTQEDEDLQEPKAPFTQMDDHIATTALKRKASVDSVSDNDEQSQWSMDIDRDDVDVGISK